jgi:hypothetical protein
MRTADFIEPETPASDGGAELLAAPRNPRELFLLFRHYDREATLQGLLDGIDFAGVDPLQVYYSVHRRSPDRLRGALTQGYSAKKHFGAALCSGEFQSRVIAHVLNAFSEKKRTLFVHIPKCAGSDLSHHLAPRFLSFEQRLASELWVSKEALFEALAEAAKAIETADEIFVHGHIELHRYFAAAGLRPGDRVFTILRDPVEMAISQANYAITLLVKDPEGSRPDARRNLELLGLTCLPERSSPETLKELALQAFLDTRITQPNLICWYLGGNRRDAREAIRNLVVNNIEVTETGRYNAWLWERWGIASRTRENSSSKFLARDDVAGYAEHIDRLTGEDRNVFDLISWALSQQAAPSIRGAELLALVANGGPYRVDFERDEIIRRPG